LDEDTVPSFQSTVGFTGFSSLLTGEKDSEIRTEITRLRQELQSIRDEIGRGRSDSVMPLPFYLTKIEDEDMNFGANHPGLNIILMNSKVTTMNLNGVNKVNKRSKSVGISKSEPKKKNRNKKKKEKKHLYAVDESDIPNVQQDEYLNNTTEIIHEISEDDTDLN
jgi:hypothetical protein